MKTGYKGTYNLTCRGHKFEIGQTYELPSKPVLCSYGFHYCQNPIDVLFHYPIKYDFNLLEIEDFGEIDTDGIKSATNKIKIIREIPKEEYYSLFGIINNKLMLTGPLGRYRYEYDEQNNLIHYEYPCGFWAKQEYDERNNLIYIEDSYGWTKFKYNEQNNLISSEDSSGVFVTY